MPQNLWSAQESVLVERRVDALNNFFLLSMTMLKAYFLVWKSMHLFSLYFSSSPQSLVTFSKKFFGAGRLTWKEGSFSPQLPSYW